MALKLMGKKRGMTQLFDEKGNVVACTVIEVEPNIITQIKTKETDGYIAIQTAFDKIQAKDPRTVEKRAGKPQLGFCKKNNVEPRRHFIESRLEDVEGYSVGQEIGVNILNEVEYVDATAISIGKGFQGAMKLHNFKGGRATHGASKIHRKIGSSGQRSTPGRVFPGKKRPCHMGMNKVTIQNLKVISVDEQENLILLAGSVPGPRNGVVTLRKALKSGVKSA